MKLKKVKLGELYTVHNGLSKGGKFFGKGFPFLLFSTVFNNYFLPETLADLVLSTETERENYDIKAGDIFITRTSETSDELGMTSVALKDYPNATYNGFTKRMRPIDSTKVFPRYIGYYLRMNQFRQGFMAFSTMTTRASLKNEDLLGMEVSLPEYSIQVKVANILSAYDDLIENNQKQIKLLEEAAQRLYREWFVDLHFPGHEQTKIVDGVPEGWCWGSIKDVINFHDTKRKPLSSMERESFKGQYRYFGAAGILDYVAGFLFDGIYLLLGEDGSVVTSDGYPILQYVDGKFWVNNHAHVLTGRNPFSTEFVYMMFKNLKVTDIVTGVAQPKISQERLSKKKIIIPAIELVNQYQALSKTFFAKILILQKQITLLTEARDRLLPKLMNGEIEI